MRSLKSLLVSKMGYIYHPVGAAIVAFLVGLLIMWLVGMKIVPLNFNLGICPCK